MKSHYKRLGDYIREVNVRNRDLAVTRLVGLSIDKIFITSVANTIGTDMSNYKIIRKGQFACSLMQVSRDEKIPIAMLRDDEAIMSPAYPMFEVIDTAILLPEYLMMWFSRSEFDREASFYAVGGVRGSLTWEDFCNLTLPIPAIEVQREIVSEYEALSRRISLNESICDKLEQAAAALYRKTFIDNIDPQNLPHGWRMGTIGELFELQREFDLPSQSRIGGQYPIYASTGIAEYHECYKVKSPGVVTGRSGSIGEVFYVDMDFWPLNTTLWVKKFIIATPLFAYYKIKELDLSKRIAGFAAVPTLNRNDVHSMTTTIPPQYIINEFENIIFVINRNSTETKSEIEKLKALQTLLLSKLATN